MAAPPAQPAVSPPAPPALLPSSHRTAPGSSDPRPSCSPPSATQETGGDGPNSQPGSSIPAGERRSPTPDRTLLSAAPPCCRAHPQTPAKAVPATQPFEQRRQSQFPGCFPSARLHSTTGRTFPASGPPRCQAVEPGVLGEPLGRAPSHLPSGASSPGHSPQPTNVLSGGRVLGGALGSVPFLPRCL